MPVGFLTTLDGMDFRRLGALSKLGPAKKATIHCVPVLIDGF